MLYISDFVYKLSPIYFVGNNILLYLESYEINEFTLLVTYRYDILLLLVTYHYAIIWRRYEDLCWHMPRNVFPVDDALFYSYNLLRLCI